MKMKNKYYIQFDNYEEYLTPRLNISQKQFNDTIAYLKDTQKQLQDDDIQITLHEHKHIHEHCTQYTYCYGHGLATIILTHLQAHKGYDFTK